MNKKDLAKQFWDQGYLLLENFFDEQLMNLYNSLILDHFGLNPKFFHNQEFLEKASTEVIPWFPQNEGVKDFDIVDNDINFLDLTQAILGEGWHSDYSMVMFSAQGTKGQAWHQDCAPEDPENFNLNRLIYTMDITPEIGGEVVVVPGSHRWGILSPSKNVHEDIDGQVILSPKKGDLLFLHGHAWHRVLPIRGLYRVSTNYRSLSKDTPAGITDVCVYRNMRYQFSTNTVIEERV